jgi:cobalt-zinc-cadmium efflux system membrane fusion protein
MVAAQAQAARDQVKTRQAEAEAARAQVAQAAAHVESLRAAQRQAAARQEAAQRRRDLAEQALRREEQIFQRGLLTSQEVVTAEAAVREAGLARNAAAETVTLLGGLPGGSPTVAVTAPLSGRVQTRTLSLGEMVDPARALFTLANLNVVWVQLSLPPRDLSHVREGQWAELTADAAPGRTYRGTVARIGDQASEETRAVKVRVALPNPGGRLKPGLFMRGHLITDLRRERVVVPVGALQDHNGKPTVYLFEGTEGSELRNANGEMRNDRTPDPDNPQFAIRNSQFRFEVRHVVLGEKGDGWQEVSEGLVGGERIAVQGTFFLKSEALKDSLSDSCCAAEE